MMIGAGELDQLVTIEQRGTRAPDALGVDQAPWVALATDVWAKAEPLRGREFFAAVAGQQQQAADVRFVLRHRADITSAMRVVWNGQPHAIVGPPINVDGAGEYLELMTVAGVGDGR